MEELTQEMIDATFAQYKVGNVIIPEDVINSAV